MFSKIMENFPFFIVEKRFCLKIGYQIKNKYTESIKQGILCAQYLFKSLFFVEVYEGMMID